MGNINSYGAGRVVFSPEDLAQVSPADRKFEIFGLRNACKFGFVMGRCSTVRLDGRADNLEMSFSDGEVFQMDGEAFHLDMGCQVSVKHNRQVMMLRPPTC